MSSCQSTSIFLANEPAIDTLATFLQIFKQLTARELKSPDQKQFWQRRYYDFNVSSPEKYVEKLQIHPSQPGQAQPGHEPRGLSLEQLQPLRNRQGRPRRNRIRVDLDAS